jgi:alkylhydroperoxidase/carboxymuconolactone decarboxylase family protein YurZ
MAAARKRLAEKTARAIQDARVLAIRAAMRPGATQEEIQELARSFYPRLDAELLAETTRIVWDRQTRRDSSSPPRAEEPAG